MYEAKINEFVADATRKGVVITADDVDASVHGDLFVDGMNAEEWLEIMTQD